MSRDFHALSSSRASTTEPSDIVLPASPPLPADAVVGRKVGLFEVILFC
jgi:hypothetical protein